MTQDCSATSGSSVFNNSIIIIIESLAAFTGDPELSYKLNDDDVSLVMVPQLKGFIFVRWLVGIKNIFLNFDCTEARKK